MEKAEQECRFGMKNLTLDEIKHAFSIMGEFLRDKKTSEAVSKLQMGLEFQQIDGI